MHGCGWSGPGELWEIKRWRGSRHEDRKKIQQRMLEKADRKRKKRRLQLEELKGLAQHLGG